VVQTAKSLISVKMVHLHLSCLCGSDLRNVDLSEANSKGVMTDINIEERERKLGRLKTHRCPMAQNTPSIPPCGM